MPIDPPPTRWRFPSLDDLDANGLDANGLVAIGADEEPATILEGYRRAMFPMPIEADGPLGWWSPDPRGILELDNLRVSRSLRRSMRSFEFRVDTSFDDVVTGCADPTRPHGWIDDRIRSAYRRLFDLGWAHSVETWRDDQLVGGLYGLSIGGLFAAESKFHRVTDASKAALVYLVDGLRDGFPRLIDVQWRTDHLTTLGASELRRDVYLDRLEGLLLSPPPAFLSGPPNAS